LFASGSAFSDRFPEPPDATDSRASSRVIHSRMAASH
jgi:hypothetical protein